jgi:3-dehydroquinate dehydratase / shikimate dehydrogenase
MIIVPITGPSMDQAEGQLASSARYADLFEIRIDLLQSPDLARLVSLSKRPVIATCRPVREGGAFSGGEEERLYLLQQAIDAGVQYVDLELDAWVAGRQRLVQSSKVIKWVVSQHVLSGALPRPDALYSKLRKTGGDILKFAYMASDAWQIETAIRFLALARADKQKAIAIAMGEAGEASRILYRVLGGWATFASPEDGRESAPGQLRASVMKGVFRAHQRTGRTKVFGLVGNPVGQSKGIFIHNPIYHRLGKDAIYCRFKIENLSRFMTAFDGLLTGCSVTTPHKQAIMKFLTKVDPLARKLGAVNSIVLRRNGFFGANTDARAALDAIEKRTRVRRKRFVVIGAGGAARAIAGEAARRGADVYIVNRTKSKAKSVARSLGVKSFPLELVANLNPEILANATSVGMWPDSEVSPIASIPNSVRVAFDAIYNPSMTKFLRDAEADGATVITGVEMYARQAVEQIRVFLGKKPSEALVTRLFLSASEKPKQLHAMQNTDH